MIRFCQILAYTRSQTQTLTRAEGPVIWLRCLMSRILNTTFEEVAVNLASLVDLILNTIGTDPSHTSLAACGILYLMTSGILAILLLSSRSSTNYLLRGSHPVTALFVNKLRSLPILLYYHLLYLSLLSCTYIVVIYRSFICCISGFD